MADENAQPQDQPSPVNPVDVPGSDERKEATGSPDQLEQPLRNRSVEEDQEPITKHTVVDNEQGGREAITESHVPGTALGGPAAEQDRASTAEAQEAAAERDRETAEAFEDAARQVPAVPDVRSPELAYATKGNIQHPGPLGEALRAEAVAQAELGEGVTVDVDPTLVAAEAVERDVPVQEVLDEKREQVELPDEPTPAQQLQ